MDFAAMRVFTYFQPCRGMARPDRLIQLWEDSWSKQGWEPVVLDQSDAEQHPGFDDYHSAIMRLPTVNNREYENACYLRHMAMACQDGGLLTDYDVINRNFAPSDLEHCWHDRVQGSWPVFLEPTMVPCALYCDDPEGWENFTDAIMEHPAAGMMHKGRPHVSDQDISRALGIGRCVGAFCVEHLCSGSQIPNDLGDGWKRAKMIHFSNASFVKLGAKGDRVTLIKAVLNKLPPTR